MKQVLRQHIELQRHVELLQQQRASLNADLQSLRDTVARLGAVQDECSRLRQVAREDAELIRALVKCVHIVRPG